MQITFKVEEIKPDATVQLPPPKPTALKFKIQIPGKWWLVLFFIVIALMLIGRANDIRRPISKNTNVISYIPEKERVFQGAYPQQ